MAKKKNEQAVETQNVELTPEQDQKKLEESLDVIPLNKESDASKFAEETEKERKNIFVVYKKARTKSNIIMAVVVVIFIASIILATQFKGWGMIVGGSMIGATLIFLVVNFILTKNLLPNTSKNYIRFFMTKEDEYVFDNENIHEAKLYFEKRYNLADTLADRLYKDVIDCVSRNIVGAKYKEVPFECGELAFYKAGVRRNQKEVTFVGRYLSLENKMHFEDRYIVSISGAKDADGPTDVDDLVVLSEQNNFKIYGKENAKYERDLGKDLINNLKSIECVNSLLHVNVVFWAGHTSVYLSYDDSVVTIPFDREIDSKVFAQLKQNIRDILEILIG